MDTKLFRDLGLAAEVTTDERGKETKAELFVVFERQRISTGISIAGTDNAGHEMAKLVAARLGMALAG